MSIGDRPLCPVGPLDVTAAAQDLVGGLLAEPWGQVSPSVYETGRLVTLAPWLTGHSERLRFLLAAQRPDGAWGPPHAGYALVPTLSATEAMLATLLSPGPHGHPGVERAELVKSADEGLRTLFRRLHGSRTLELPDMPAIEHIAPSLIRLINRHLEALCDQPPAGLGAWQGTAPLRPPAGMDDTGLSLIRSRLRSAQSLPQKLLHALEIAGEAAAGAPLVQPESTGTIGASPAATAAWLGDREPADPGHPARRYLEAVTARHAGPAPCAVPITVFERGWVLGWLARAGVPVTVPGRLITELEAALGPSGTPAAAGLPADSDTTAGALYALAQAGAPHPPDMLWEFEAETHFCTWRGEDGRSVSTNAHVLEAFAHYLEVQGRAGEPSRYAATVAKVSSWLCDQQEADGSWQDRWHASPYYATACCALALDRFGGERSAPNVDHAIEWVLDTQRPDGSWGRWDGTAEESAYAMQILLLTRSRPAAQTRGVVARGNAFLRAVAGGRIPNPDNSPLWHDKDLYLPTAIVRAAILAALHLGRSGRLVSTG